MISYLAGLPRSGSTLLASVMNENPDVFVSSSSPLCNVLYHSHRLWQAQIALKANPNQLAVHNSLSAIVPAFYADRTEKLIVDKAFSWGVPDNLSLLLQYAPEQPRFIVMTRNLDDVIASLTRIVFANPNNNFDQDFIGERTPEAIRQHLCLDGGIVDMSVRSRDTLLSQHHDRCFVVEYERLVKSPRQLLNQLYDFYGMEQFVHNFHSITNSNTDNDSVWGIPDMHKIKTSL
jgi:sulfotransferase